VVRVEDCLRHFVLASQGYLRAGFQVQGEDVNQTVRLVVAELLALAVTHHHELTNGRAPVHRSNLSLELDVRLEHELLGDLLLLLLFHSTILIFVVHKNVSDNIELSIKGSLNDTSGLGQEVIEVFLSHFNGLVLLGENLERVFEFFLFPFLSLVFRFWGGGLFFANDETLLVLRPLEAPILLKRACKAASWGW